MKDTRSVTDFRVLADRQHRRRPVRVVFAPVQDVVGREVAPLRLELPLRGDVHSRRRSGQHIGLPRGRAGQEASQRDQLLPAVAGGGRPSRQPLRHAAGRHSRLPG